MLAKSIQGVKLWTLHDFPWTCNALCVTIAVMETPMKRYIKVLARKNVKLAKEKWFDELGNPNLHTLRSLTESYGFAVALGDLLLLEGRWYVTHAGLLRLAARSRCCGSKYNRFLNSVIQ